MRFRLLPGTFAAFVGICGSGLLMKYPDYTQQIGTILIVLSVLILAFSVRVEGANLSIGRPNPFRSFWWSISHRRVPFGEAARLFYEAMERSEIDDMTLPGYSNPIIPLDHFKYVLLSAAKRESIVLNGARPPSRQSRQIPSDEIAKLEPDRNDPNGLRALARGSRTPPSDFSDVWISRRDLRRAIKDRIELLERVDKGLSE